jgi:hypothetical protein
MSADVRERPITPGSRQTLLSDRSATQASNLA